MRNLKGFLTVAAGIFLTFGGGFAGADASPNIWFRAEGGIAPVRAVAIVAHGLNLRPDRMNAIVGHLQGHGVDVLRIALTGHRGVEGEFRKVTPQIWQNDFREAWGMARARADELKVPLLFVGYSLGALVAETFVAENADVHFDRAVLFAPAIAVRWHVKLLKLLGIFGRNFVVPSENLPDYRANAGTPVAAYQALFEAMDRLEKAKADRLNVPTVVILDPEDEAIDPGKILAFRDKNQLSNWEMFAVDNSGSRLPKKFHHLTIDAQAVGSAQWGKILERISRFFGL